MHKKVVLIVLVYVRTGSYTHKCYVSTSFIIDHFTIT